ncbi:MAG: hypothetical protein Q9162_007766, partial [Coniocarpon cinnabarinum]
MLSNPDNDAHDGQDGEPAMVDADEIEEVEPDGDAAMDSASDEEDTPVAENADHLAEGAEIQLQNDSVAHFDQHMDSIFCIAQHPVDPNIIATGAGDDTGYIFSLPSSESSQYSKTNSTTPRPSIQAVAKIEGHTDSLNALTFTLPNGDYFLSAGLDGQLRAYKNTASANAQGSWKFLGSVKEVDEINWLAPCPNPANPNTIALGGSDGSVWVYSIDANAANGNSPLLFINSFFLHTDSCTAGAWTPDGKLLATTSQDGSFYVWDVFGDAAAAGVVQPPGSNSVVGLTEADERFNVDGGLYSLAISPTGTIAAVGGEGGNVRIVGLPRLAEATADATVSAKGGAGAKTKVGGGKKEGGPKGGETSAGQAGHILASLQAQSESIETLAFSPNAAIPLLAVGSVDGSIAFFDTKSNFSLRKHLKGAHDDMAVTKVEF